MKKLFPILSVFCFIISCSPIKKNQGTNLNVELKFLDEFDIPHNAIYRNTIVGGLSGIDYDATNNLYYLICDDRSSLNPARFYTASIRIKGNKIDTVEFVAVNSLLQRNGTVFPNSKQDPFHTPDPEAIRYNPNTGRLIWSSEGERFIRKDTVVLENPSIYEMSITGKILDSFPLSSNLLMQSVEKGPRQNGVFEGMTFHKGYQQLLVSVEEPLYEDGHRAGLNDSTGIIRMIRYDAESRKMTGQFGYVVEPVAFPATTIDGYRINGIPDILSLNDSMLLVMERSFSTGRPGCTIRLFLANLNGATDISQIESLRGSTYQPIRKKLILNMDNLGFYIDNVEGMCWGPTLANGHRSLIFVADNNFSADEVTQFLLFEIKGESF